MDIVVRRGALRFAALFLLGPAVCVAQAQGGRYEPVIARLHDTIPPLMRRDSVLGLAIALVDREGVVWSSGFGYTSQDRHERVTPATVFSLQSISKTYTTVGFLRAFERGWMRLDEPLVRVLPEFTVHARDDSTSAQRITFRELLSHHGGLPHEAPRGSNFDYCDCSLAEHVRSIGDVWLLAPPGERYAYSNLGFDLVAYALERRAAESFAVYMQHAVLGPAGMTASTYDFATARRSPSFAQGQVSGKDGPMRAIPMVGAGGMYSNVIDMARFLRIMLRAGDAGTQRLVASRTIDTMTTVQFPVDGEVGNGYGLGVYIRRWRGQRIIWHTGGGYGYTTAQQWVPGLGIGVVVLTNDGGNGIVAREVADRALELMADVLGARDTLEAPPYLAGDTVSLPLSALRRLAGTYRSYSGRWVFEVRDGALYVASPVARQLFAHSATEFIDGHDRYRFHLDSLGNADRIDDLGANGQDVFVINERVGEPKGPDLPEWRAYVGQYEGHAYGEAVPAQITLRNGYLWASTRGGSKLIPFQPGLFFTVWGESVQFRGDTLRLRGAPFLRVAPRTGAGP